MPGQPIGLVPVEQRVPMSALTAMREQRDYLLGALIRAGLDIIERDAGRSLTAAERAAHGEILRQYGLALATTRPGESTESDNMRAIARGERWQ